MTHLRIGNVSVGPSQIKFGSLGEIFLPDSSSVRIPLIVVNGSRSGPILWISSTMHGTELTGAEVIRRITRELITPRKLRGAIVALPIVNPLAFHHHSMNTPQDEYNLNRVFPGSPTGSTSFRMADLLFKEGVLKCDYLLDFHANPIPAMPFSIVKETSEPNISQKSIAMAKAFGITTIQMEYRHEPQRTGTITERAGMQRKPALTVELLYWRRIDPTAVNVGVRGTLNILKHLDMIDGRIEKQTEVEIITGDLSRVEVTANKGGIVHTLIEPGQWVKKGERIAEIYDPYGDIVEKVNSPLRGFILAFPFLGNQAVATGDTIAFVGFRRGDH